MMQPDSLNAALTTDSINTALASIAKQSAVNRGEVVDNRASMGTMYDTSDTLGIDVLIAVQSGCPPQTMSQALMPRSWPSSTNTK
jgi:hypothetical protein